MKGKRLERGEILHFFLRPGSKNSGHLLTRALTGLEFGVLRSPPELNAVSLAFLGAAHSKGTVYFIEDFGFLSQLKEAGAHAVICPPDLEDDVKKIGVLPIVAQNPKETFFRLYNYIAETRLSGLAPTVVHPSAKIDSSARVADHGVVIEENVEVLAGSQILERVRLGRDSVIGNGAIIGSSGFEFKKISAGGYLPVIHDGYVGVGVGCSIGAGSVVAQGFWDRPTLIGDGTKLDHLVGISHGVNLGSFNMIAAGAVLAGSVETGEGVWIGPGAVVSNGVKLGSFSRVEIGSVVLRDWSTDSRVFGNPAREMTFLKNF